MSSYESRAVSGTIAGYKSRINDYVNNRDLSEIGKQNGISSVQAEAAGQRSWALTMLKAERARLGAEFKLRKDAFTASEERAAQKWDFNRLNYHSTAIRAKIATLSAQDNVLSGTRSIDTLRNEYQAALKSGDRHLARAWAEIAPPIVLEHFAAGQFRLEAESLTADMRRELDKITWDADCQKAWDKFMELRTDALEFKAAAAEAHAFYEPRSARDIVFGGPSEFTRLSEGVYAGRYPQEQVLEIEPEGAPVGQ